MKFIRVVKANQKLDSYLNQLKLELKTKEQDVRYNPEEQETIDALKTKIDELQEYIDLKKQAINNFCNIDFLVTLFLKQAKIDDGTGQLVSIPTRIKQLGIENFESLDDIAEELKNRLIVK